MSLGAGIPYLAGIAAALTIVGAYLYHKKKREFMPKTWEEVGFIEKLNLYPLKSGHKLELRKAECTTFGLKQTEECEKVYQLRDKFLIVCTEKEHEFRTARTYPKLLTIDVSVHDENHLAIDSPTMRTLYVKIPTVENENGMTVKFGNGEKMYTIDCGDEAASWLSRYILGKDFGLRLGYNNGKYESNVPKTQQKLLDYYKPLSTSSTEFNADLTILLVSQASVNDLNSRLGDYTVTVDNFKPNIVVNGSFLKPYSEDDWEWMKIGHVIFRNVKNCTNNFEYGSTGKESVETFDKSTISKGPKERPVMGIHLEIRKTGFISVGDKVFITKVK